MKAFLKKHGQALVNLFVFICLGNYAIERASKAWFDWWVLGKFEFVEVAFFVHNVIFLTLILVRKQHIVMERKVVPQLIALAAFFSGIFFQQTPPMSQAFVTAGTMVVLMAILLGAISLLNLGRSFGILIAFRSIKTRGLYSVVRHPMYFTDILWRVGIVLKNLSAVNAILFVASSACYVYRAILEERFLSQQPEYREYMERVRYRFIPGVF